MKIPNMEMFKFGETHLGLPIHGFYFKNSQSANKAHAFILGGVHGDEPEGVVAAKALLEIFRENFNLSLNITVVPEFNPEGILNKVRMNSRGVDLNRNLPTKDWSAVAATVRYNPGPSPLSESENKALVQWLNQNTVQLIISLHSWKPMLNTNGLIPEAEIISKMTGYKIEPDIGYPTPGSLGTYAGLERQIPTLTYEIERDMAFDQIIKMHVPAIIEGLKISALLRKI